MENRIKECQLDLWADRTSTAIMKANQLRLWFSSFAYVLIEAVQQIALAHTELAHATCGMIRLKLLKIDARITISVRRIKIAITSACPFQNEFALAHAHLRKLYAVSYLIMFLISGSTGLGLSMAVLGRAWRLTDRRHRLRSDWLAQAT
jgi:hypothetical protein